MLLFLRQCVTVKTKSRCGTSNKVCPRVSHFGIYVLMHTGTLQQEMSFTHPQAAIFFNHDPNKLIVASWDGIYLIDVSTQSILSFSSTPQNVQYKSHALALSDDDAVLVAGHDWKYPISVCGYDAASLTRLWILNTASHVDAVCMHGAHVLVTVCENPMLVVDYKTGAHIATLKKVNPYIYALGVIEGLCCFFLTPLNPSDLHTSVYLAMLQHLLYKQAKALRLPLEMWDWIAKYQL
jgi:hypothetical protein